MRITTITVSRPPSDLGVDTDLDGDGFTNEMTRADVTAVSLWQAALAVPGRVIPAIRRSRPPYSPERQAFAESAARDATSQPCR